MGAVAVRPVPGRPDGSLRSVRPDLLAEYHAAVQLTARLALAQAILRGLTPGQAGRELTVLPRAWGCTSASGR